MESATLTPAVEPEPQHTPTPIRPTSSGRLGYPWPNYLKMLLGTPSKRRLAWAALYVDQIRYWESEFSKLSDDELKAHGMQ